MKSYSKQIKESLLEIQPKKKCCKRIQDDVFEILSINDTKVRAEKVAMLISHYKCAGCQTRSLATLFIAFGNVTDPEKRYHLEFSLESEEERAALKNVLDHASFSMKETTRKGRYILYIKDSERIEDFFALIGANKAAFDFINAKIIHEVRGNANRQMNCDMANINKSISAAESLVEMITEMDEKGYISRMTPELQETARLRMMNNQASIAEVGALHNPPISKSGVKHRLDKIKELYTKFMDEE